MPKLIVTADVHGSYGTWLTLKELLSPGDGLIVAGDLFGTRYPRYGSPDYQPDVIREELVNFDHPFYFIYGNCDKSSFSPGYTDNLTIEYMECKIFIHHGHRYLKEFPFHSGLIIQGHTHVPALEEKNGLILLNPGSLSAPRSQFHTYGTIENGDVKVINIKTGETMKALPFPVHQR